MNIVHRHVCVFTWEGEAEKGSQEKVWSGGGWSPVMGRTRLGGMRDEATLVVKWPALGQLGRQIGLTCSSL